jgi:hypothetical protein
MLRVPRQVNLPVLADDAPALVHENGRVEASRRSPAVHAQLGIAETEPDAESPRLVEDWARLRPRHLALEEGVDLALVFHPPAGKERGEGQLGKDHEIATVLLGSMQEIEQSLDHLRPRVGALYRAQLCRSHRHNPSDGSSPPHPLPQ